MKKLLLLTVLCFIALSTYSQIISTIAGTNQYPVYHPGGAATATTIYDPRGIAIDRHGNIYIADLGYQCIWKITPAGACSLYAGGGAYGMWNGTNRSDGRPATDAALLRPRALAVDNTGNVYFSEEGWGSPSTNQMSGAVIRKIDTAGIVTTIAGSYTYLPSLYYTGYGGPAVSAAIFKPRGLATDAAGNLYITEGHNRRVLKIDFSTGILTQIAGQGHGSYTGPGGTLDVNNVGDGGPATNAVFTDVTGVTVDCKGNVYVVDFSSVRKIDTSGIITRLAGVPGTWGYNYLEGAAYSTMLDQPLGVAVDGGGNIYIAEGNGMMVRVVDTSGTIHKYAGNAGASYSGDGGPAISAGLGEPWGLAVDRSGNLYIGGLTYYHGDQESTYYGGYGILRKVTHAITGVSTLCPGTSQTLTDALGSGSWSSSAPGIASVGPAGIITGVSAGIAIITHTVSSSCASAATTLTVTVNPLPAAGSIMGADRVCRGATTLFTNSGGVVSGNWTSSNTGVAQVNTEGIVSGISAGVATITYTATTPCGSATTTKNITVEVPLSSAPVITGSFTACLGLGTTLTGTPAGGTWSSSVPGIVSVSSTGVTSGVSIYGHATISYTISNSCGSWSDTQIMTTVLPPSVPVITTIAGNGTAAYAGDNGPATSAKLSHPKGVAFDRAGNMYVVDAGNYCVRKISTTNVITTFAGSGFSGFSGDGGAATSARLKGPTSVCVDSAGNVYIADSAAHRIRKVSTSGVISTIAGTGIAGYSGDNGAATAAKLNGPIGVAADAAGNVYIGDRANHRIRKVGTGGIITTVAGTGTAGNTGDYGAATAAQLAFPTGVALDAAGNLYIADNYGCGIRKVYTLSRNIVTIAGDSYPGFYGDGGPATDAQFRNLYNIAVDQYGTIYVADYKNNRIRSIGGSIARTIAGLDAGGYSNDGGLPTEANLNAPKGIAIDAKRNIYIADDLNHRIRKLSASALPANTGSLIICPGATTTLGNIVPGGTWSSDDTTVATVNSLTGIVTGVAEGLVNIAYTVANECGSISATTVVTVNPSPYAEDISGVPSICLGGSATLTDTTNGTSAWSSSNSAIVSINAAGIVGGISAGMATITYISTNSCGSTTRTKDITVNTALSSVAVSGPLQVCITSPVTLTGTPSGGSWTSGNTLIATVASTGKVTGITTGSVDITYSKTNSCGTTGAIRTVTVSAPLSQSLIATIAGTGIPGYGGDGGAATAARLNAPTGVATDSAGNIYVSDKFNYRVRRISPSGIITTILGRGTPSSSGDGGQATAAYINIPMGIATDRLGNIYIADSASHRVRRIDASGIVTTVAGNGSAVGSATGDGGAATAAKIVQPTGIAVDNSGNIYIADYGDNRIRKVNTSGIISTIAGTGSAGGSGNGGAATAAELNKPLGIALDGAGNLYIADNFGGRVRKISTSGIITVFAGSGGGGSGIGDGGAATAAKLDNPNDVTVDASGNVYITDSRNDRIRMVNTSGIITTIAGGSGGYSGDNGPATAARIDNPYGIATDLSGNIYFADNRNYCIRKVMPAVPAIIGSSRVCAGSSVTLTNAMAGGRWSSSSTSVASVDSMTGVVTGIAAGTAIISYTAGNNCGSASVVFPITVSPPSAGTITGASLVCAGATLPLTDTGATSTGEWSASNTSVATVNAVGVVTGVSTGSVTISYSVTSSCGIVTATKNIAVGVPAVSLSVPPLVCISSPATLTGSPAGGSWTSGNTSIASIGASSGIVTGKTGGSAAISYTASNSCGSSTATTTITISASPSIAVITTYAGTGTSGYAGDSGLATAARLNAPAGVAVDNAGNIYVSDRSNHRVRRITPSGMITTILGTGIPFSGGDGGAATAAWIDNPMGIAIDGSGNIYIADSASHRVRKIDASGVITTIAGNGNTFGSLTGDGGAATAAKVVQPMGVAVDNSGNLYIADYDDNRIRKVNASGVITTIAGNGSAGSSGDGGAATAARLSRPQGIACDGAGNLYIADNGNDRVRKINTSGIISLFAGTGSGGGSLGDGGAATAASVSNPLEVFADAAGNVYISSGSRVRKVNASGIITTVAGGGSGGGSYSGDNGPATAAVMSTPYGIAMDRAGNIYIADKGNNRIRKVNATAVPGISGNTSLCAGASITLANAMAGGTWSSSNTSVASVDSATGVVTGIAAGTAAISYALTNSCGVITAATTITVNAPSAGTISGVSAICAGSVATLTNTGASGTGTWFSSNTALATVNASGVVRGVSAGAVLISYTVSNSCGSATATRNITVETTVAPAISGPLTVCLGTPATLSGLPAGGTWASNNIAAATISASGMVTGVSAGNTTITYTATNSCGSGSIPAAVTISAIPAVPADITGTPSVCAGSVATLANSVAGGTWSSSNTSVATVSATGVVSGAGPGDATIMYTIGNSCGSNVAPVAFTVNPLPAMPAAISGSTLLCVGAASALNDTVAGGAWSSSNAAIATVDAAGTVTGVSAGSASIVYTTSNSCGSRNIAAPVTVNALPAVPAIIAGPSAVCSGSLATLSNTVGGGVWSSSDETIATVNAAGVVSTVGAGTATVFYTIDNNCGSYAASSDITVDMPTIPSVISGMSPVCAGSSTVLSDAVAGGTWSSSDTTIATIDDQGIVNAVSTGTATISYTISNSCGTNGVAAVVTVNPLPAELSPVTGMSSVCVGASATLSNAVAGGAWSSSNAAVATVDASGVVNGVHAGNATITYTTANSCGISTVTRAVAINPLPEIPSAIVGPMSVCAGSWIILSDSVSGGAWSSGNETIATVDASGRVSGMSAGSTAITYTSSNGCGSSSTATTVTVLPLPAALPAIGGASNVCIGVTAILNDTVPGGFWFAADPAVAMVNSSTGEVAGMVAGTTTITYAVDNSCGRSSVATSITVNPVPAMPSAVTGTLSACAGASVTLSDTVSGGTWTSSNSEVATVDAAGIVSAVSAGSAMISYSISNSCSSNSATVNFTVDPLPTVPSVIADTITVCAGSLTTLTNAVAGGTWSSSNTAAATVSAAGVVSGLTVGSTTIRYTIGNSCGSNSVSALINVNPSPVVPSVITGASSVCSGLSISLSDSVAGGTWSSSNPSVASVNTSGRVYGISGGTATISYTISNSCGSAYATHNIAVGAMPDTPTAITGPMWLCAGSAASLANGVSGGTWSSSNSSAATITASGVVYGAGAGGTVISYTVSTACGSLRVTLPVTVYGSPVAITGPTSVCAGSAVSLSNPMPGGIWSVSNTSRATVNASTGVVTGVTAGSVTITYAGCGGYRTFPMVVNGLPSAISGANILCMGAAAALSDATTGGTWSISGGGNATINASTHVVTGLNPGTETVSYTLSTGCSVTLPVTVNITPVAIATVSPVCVGSAVMLADATPGGTWSSTNTSKATVDAAGLLTAVSSGTLNIMYAIGSCSVSRAVVINSVPGAINGSGTVCAGTTVNLSDATPGGNWSASDTSVASVVSGTVNGLSAGVARIRYTLSTGCYAAKDVTVNISPAALSSVAPMCTGTSVSLANSVPGGVWSSSNTSKATVSADGIVTALGAVSSVAIRYSIGSCMASTSFSVNTTPGAISGSTVICNGATVTVSDIATGGTWSSSNGTIASISGSAVSAALLGASAGTATISYTIANCVATKNITVSMVPDPLPAIPYMCTGTSMSLSNSVAGGTWSSSNTSKATVSTDGLLTASNATPSVTIRYGIGTCISQVTFPVNTTPAAISGTGTVCGGSTTTLFNTLTGGTWSSGDSSVATLLNSSLPVTVRGVTAGIATITYSVNNCYKTKDMTVYTSPAPLADIGSMCTGTSISLAEAVPGGVWSSSNTSKATVNTTGIVTALGSVSSVSIRYTIGTCVTQTTFSVNQTPAQINGGSTVCSGSVVTLSDVTAGGTWSSSNPAIASVMGSGTSTGVRGMSPGTAVLSYTLTGCSMSKTITVNNCGSRESETGPDASNNTASIRIYPNPATSIVNIAASVSVNVQVYSADGRLVQTVNDAKEINLGGEAAGLYMLVIYDSNNNLLARERVVKE